MGIHTVHEYIKKNNEGEVKKWLSKCTDIDEADDQQQSPLHVACSNGLTNIVKMLLKRGASCNVLDAKGWTPLHCAASAWDFKICALLLKTGRADVNIMTPSGSNALSYLCRTQNCDPAEQVKLLQQVVAAGAEVDVCNKFGETALHQACLRGTLPSVTFLLSAGADVNKPNASVSSLSLPHILHFANEMDLKGVF